ncbi:MAG: hypothetical protein OEZ21_00960 [Candidatus Bathyarchaeota archaeon]|nr:hypothetical protein [Candidatus Bathyarchaeota archaeon]MDH5745511.1 hypothetical protein [Candidatus Bathyarchaeota archaeon]
MSIVKPPSFEELVETYGTPKKALLHLIEAGFSPEQIEWKMGVTIPSHTPIHTRDITRKKHALPKNSECLRKPSSPTRKKGERNRTGKILLLFSRKILNSWRNARLVLRRPLSMKL